jgi:hypothetical protein
MPDQPIPLGPPLDSSDDDLDAAAEISADDIEAAKDTVRRQGRGTDLPRLLEAEEDAS